MYNNIYSDVVCDQYYKVDQPNRSVHGGSVRDSCCWSQARRTSRTGTRRPRMQRTKTTTTRGSPRRRSWTFSWWWTTRTRKKMRPMTVCGHRTRPVTAQCLWTMELVPGPTGRRIWISTGWTAGISSTANPIAFLYT